MADQETTVPLDDKGMLSDIMAERPEPQPEAPSEPERVEPREDATGRLHGEKGRFVPKPDKDADAAPIQQQAPAEPDPATAQQPTDDDKGGQVPSWRLREVREAREAAERRAEEATRQAYADRQQMAALQRQLAELQKPEPVDFFQNPEGAIQQRITPIEERFNNLASQLTYRASLAENVAIHGHKAVEEMRQALSEAHRSGDPEIAQLDQQMTNSADPVAIAMQWHKRAKLLKVTGGDPDAYKARILEDAMKDPEFQAKVLEAARGQAQSQPNTRPNVQLPPSLNKATGAGVPNANPEDDADNSERGIFKYAMAPGRR